MPKLSTMKIIIRLLTLIFVILDLASVYASSEATAAPDQYGAETAEQILRSGYNATDAGVV